MARKSAAAKAIKTPPRPKAEPLRAPAHLGKVARSIWTSVVASKSADFFDAGCAPLLDAYATACAEHRKLSEAVEKLDPLKDWETLSKLSRLMDIHATRIVACATKLRLTNQSRYAPATAARKAEGSSTLARIRARYAEDER